MANILVGDPDHIILIHGIPVNALYLSIDCPFQDVVKIFQQSPCSNIVAKNWRSLARSFKTSQILVDQQNQKLLLTTLTEFDVIQDMLIDWRNRKSKKSTLGELIWIVEDELKWNQIAMSLRNIIKGKAKCWNDLDEHYKSEIFNMKIFFQGQSTSLKWIENLVGKEKLEKILCKHFSGTLLQKALRNETWSLDNWNVLERPPYYVERTLKIQRKLDRKIFQQKCADIFVFEGIPRPNLSSLVDPEATAVSSKQLDRLTVRFIILENTIDLKTIENLSTSPIHRIMFENDSFRLISTNGSTSLIKKFLLEEYEVFSEDECVTNRLSHFDSRPVTIVDSAGMGKSVLLNSIASSIKSIYSKRIVLFMTMRELVEITENKLAEIESLDVQRTIAEATTSTTFGIEVISEMMTNMQTEVEIFFDGFDEVPVANLNLLRKFLSHLSKSKNLRAHVTSRPYMQEELENICQVISLNIVAFSEQDQLKFLNCFWSNEFNPGNKSRLNNFALKCLSSIQDVIKDDNKNIAGIPLQCYILSEVYSKAAERYADESNTSDNVLIGWKSVLDLYTKFVEKKFQNVAGEERELLKLAHYYHALILLFPHSARMAGTSFPEMVSSQVPDSKIFSIGIINTRKLNGNLEFQHRTFAEFLLAEYLVTKVPTIFYDRNMCRFYFTEVLEVTKTTYGVALTDFIVERFIDVFESYFGPPNRTKQYNRLKSTLISDKARRFVLDLAYIDRSSLKGLISYWLYINDTIPSLHFLLAKLRIDLGWLKLADDFEELCVKDYRLEFKNASVCYFMNAKLSATDISLEVSNEIKTRNDQSCQDSTEQFVVQSFACAAHNFSTLFRIIACSFYSQALDKSFVLNSWNEILVSASGHDDLDLYKLLCGFFSQVCDQNWWEIKFPNKTFMHMNYAHTPLHEAVQRGNYSMTEHLLKHYDIKTMPKTSLFVNCVIATASAPSCIVDTKLDICRLLFQNDNTFFKDIDVNQCIGGLYGVTTKFLKLIIDVECETNSVRLLNLLVDSVFPFASSDDVDDLVDYLLCKKLTRILFVTNRSGLNAIQWCLACDTLKPDTMLQIYKAFPFNITKINAKRFDVLDCIFKSKWSESWIKYIVEKLGIHVNILCWDNKTLLHYAAKHRNVEAIRYLVDAGANVNAKCKRGYIPSQYVLFPKKLDNVELLAECTSLLIERTK